MHRDLIVRLSTTVGLCAALTASAATKRTETEERWWSFQPIIRPAVPTVKLERWPSTPIDRFVLATLEGKGLTPNPAATKRELLRRVYFDLIGLPPTPEEVMAFEKDASPGSYEGVVDRLLASPQYGERWGRHWLDVVRFAQSNGYERDAEKPMAWRYRDYIIKAFNQDKPFDRFIVEQLAGDELPDRDYDAIIATGFQRLGVWDDEPDDKQMAEYDELDDILSTTGAAFLGLTLGCARCHEHKFDPIPQSDYYKLLAFFRNVRPYDSAGMTAESPKFVPLASASDIKMWQERQTAKTKTLQDQLRAVTADAEKKKLEQQIAAVKSEAIPFDCALSVREHGANPPATHVLVRGNPRSTGARVEPAFLNVLGGQTPRITSAESSSGRRLALAQWIASAQNALTARVIVNRLWHHHFGRGIVATTTDFGRSGSLPTHPELLDYLADEFIDSGWSIKRLHKRIMLSSAYQMSSRAHEPGRRIDPSNQYLWRQNLRRLEAETLRDSLLAIGGQLNRRIGGRGFFPRLAGEVLAGASRPGLDWEVSSSAEQNRRAVYAYIRRTAPTPFLELFDYNNTASPLGERPVTTVAPQALLLLNDDFLSAQAEALATRLRAETGGDNRLTPAATAKQIERGYRLALGRKPSQDEMRVASDFIDRQRQRFSAAGPQITFRPDVPAALDTTYFNRLQPADFLGGTHAGWGFHRGNWAPAYEGIRALQRSEGPFALWSGVRFSNAVLASEITLHTAAEYTAVLFRASNDGDKQRGYEVVLNARDQEVALRKLGTNTTTLARAKALVAIAQPMRVIIDGTDKHLRVWLNAPASERPLLDVVDETAALTGYAGISAWGAPVTVRGFDVTTAAGRVSALPESCDASERALQAWCLLLLNLNEFVYVD